MPPGARVAIVDDVQVRTSMEAAAAALEQRAIGVARYASMDAFAADAGTVATAEVLVMSTNALLPAGVLRSASRLRAVIFPASGTETVDRELATELGIVIGHGAITENHESMAEATIMLMLAGLYDLHRSEALLRQGAPRPPLYAHMLKGRTVGLVGFGRIARSVATRLEPWHVEILAASPGIAAKELPSNVRAAELDALLAQSDIVSIHCALNEQTRGLIDARRLDLFKPTAILINTSRGPIVDEPALYEAMKAKRLAKVALDTFDVEPLPMDSRLRELPDTILTPHIVGHTIEAVEASERNLVEGIFLALEGVAPKFVRNPEVLPRWNAREKV